MAVVPLVLVLVALLPVVLIVIGAVVPAVVLLLPGPMSPVPKW